MHCLDNLLTSHSPSIICSDYLSIINFESNVSMQHHGISVFCTCVCLAVLWERFKFDIGLITKVELDLLKAEIKRLMYSLDNTPVSVVEDQGRFTEVMAAFHQYERIVRYAHVPVCIVMDEDEICESDG